MNYQAILTQFEAKWAEIAAAYLPGSSPATLRRIKGIARDAYVQGRVDQGVAQIPASFFTTLLASAKKNSL